MCNLVHKKCEGGATSHPLQARLSPVGEAAGQGSSPAPCQGHKPTAQEQNPDLTRLSLSVHMLTLHQQPRSKCHIHAACPAARARSSRTPSGSCAEPAARRTWARQEPWPRLSTGQGRPQWDLMIQTPVPALYVHDGTKEEYTENWTTFLGRHLWTYPISEFGLWD